MKDLFEEPQRADILTQLVDDGFERIGVCSSSILNAARISIAKTMTEAGLSPEEIEAVIFCTESCSSFEQADTMTSRDAFRSARDHAKKCLSSELGIVNAVFYGINMASCCNFIHGMSVANCFIRSGMYASVLLVFCDSCNANESRVLRNKLGVLSDAVSSCIVSSSGKFAIIGISSINTGLPVDKSDPGSFRDEVKRLMEACHSLRRSIEKQVEFSLDDVEWLTADNLHSSYYQIAAVGFGIDDRRIFLPTKKSLGHTFSSDCLINLKYMMEQPELICRHVLAAFNMGVSEIGAIIIRVEY